MDENAEVILKTICCTCLSVDRKLSQLCKVDNGVNNLFFLLSYESDTYDAIFYKSATHLLICWECEAIMRRLCKFRNQVREAQKQITEIIDGRINDICKVISLSHLSYYHRNEFNAEYTENCDILTDFIDCGQNIDDLKTERGESDSDIPLCELTNENDESNLIESFENKIKTKRKRSTDKKVAQKQVFNVFDEIGKNKGVICDEICHGNEIERNIMENKVETDNADNECHFINELSNIGLNDSVQQIIEKEVKLEFNKNETRLSKKKKKKLIKNDTKLTYVCTECNKYFANRSQKYKHMKISHSSGSPCAVCGKTFAFKHHLKRHERIHTVPLNREQCPTCGKMVRCDLTKAHARVHAERQRAECLKCEKTFVSQESYKNHLKYTLNHTTLDVFKYKCTMCQKAYRSKGELRDHVNYQHMGKTQHKCPICDKAIATRRGITRHVKRAHQGIKENAKDKICQTCGKAFRDKKCLYEHELIHSGERPLSCSICGRTFRQRASLYTHKRRVHNIQSKMKVVEHFGDDTDRTDRLTIDNSVSLKN